MKSSALFSYVQCDIKIPEHLGEQIPNFPPIFRNTNKCRQDIGPLMQESAEKEGLMSQPRPMLVSSSELSNGTISTPLLLFYMQLEIVCTKSFCIVEYTPVKYLNNFSQSAVSDRCLGDENPNSDVVAQNMKLLVNRSYAYQLVECSGHYFTTYMNE